MRRERHPFLSNILSYPIYLQARSDVGGTVIDLEEVLKLEVESPKF